MNINENMNEKEINNGEIIDKKMAKMSKKNEISIMSMKMNEIVKENEK